MKPYSAVSVFIDNSVSGKLTVTEELGKIRAYDPFISDLYIDRSCLYKSVVEHWARRVKIRVNDGNIKLETHREINGKKLVVYLGRTRDSIEFNRAKAQADELGCELIILP